jgi:hypothetical protein
MVEYGPYGPLATDLDREQTEAWLAEDRQEAAERAAEGERPMTPDEISDLYVEAGFCTPDRDLEAGE